MAIEKEFHLSDKVVKLLGHQDDDYFRLYTESLEARSDLSAEKKKS